MAPFSTSNMKTNDALQTNGHMMVARAMLRVLPFDLEMFSVSFPYHVLDASVMLKNEDHTHWGKNPKIHPKIHNLKISFLAKFTISKPHFSQNSHFSNILNSL